MDKFEELAAMAEAVEQLGDTPPGPEEYKEVDKALETAPEFEPTTEDLSGGLSEKPDDEAEAPLTVADLLGFNDKPETETEEKPAPDEPAQEAEPAAEPAEQESGTQSRIKELADEVGRLREQNDVLIKKGLAGPTEESPDEQQAPELEDEVKEYLTPYIQAAVEERLSQMEAELAPVRKEAETLNIAQGIGQHVEGFTKEHVPILEQKLQGMSEQERSLYTGHISGGILLAKSMADSGELKLGPKKQATSPLAQRHQSESSGRSPANAPTMSEDEQAARLMDMDSDKFLELYKNMNLGG